MTIRLNPSNLGQTRSDLGLGTAATVNTGTTNATIPLLNANGRLDAARLGSGTADATTFLRGDGSFATAGGGAWELLSVSTASDSASVEIGTPASGPFTDTHETYCIVGQQIAVRVDTSSIRMQVGVDNGSGGITFTTNNFHKWHHAQQASTNSSYLAQLSNTDSSCEITTGLGPLTNRESAHFAIYLSNMNTASATGGAETMFHGTFGNFNAVMIAGFCAGMFTKLTNSDKNCAVKFFASSGNFDGKISVYGLQKAV